MDNNHDEIMLLLGEIRGYVKGINMRLDISNGRTSKNEERIGKLESWQNNIKGRITIVSAGIGLLVAFITLIINKLWK